MLVGIAPVRMSFAGGGTDMPEYYEQNGGNVITTAITKFTYNVIHPRHDESFQAFSPDFQKHYLPRSFDKLVLEDGTEIATSIIKHLSYKTGSNVIICSDVPAGSGLGASSSLAVNLVHTISKLKGENWSNTKIAETAFHIGRNILNWPIGKQDEYISAFGGFNFIKFSKQKVTVTPIKLNKSSKEELQRNLLLFFVGDTRNSSNILTGQIERIKNKHKDTMRSLEYVKGLAQDMHGSLKKSDITKFAELLHKGWLAKKKFAKGVSTNRIDSVYDQALKHGALGGKLTGAGGGGHMILYCESNKQKSLIKKMTNLGLKQVPYTFYENGPKILNLYDFVGK
jgi:D-glycero-alpha-D-manno-heptose-7-phosphate kinase